MEGEDGSLGKDEVAKVVFEEMVEDYLEKALALFLEVFTPNYGSNLKKPKTLRSELSLCLDRELFWLFFKLGYLAFKASEGRGVKIVHHEF